MTNKLKTVLGLEGLVFQRDPAFSNLVIRLTNDKEILVAKDGCILISLFNALRLSGYKNDFYKYNTELVNGKCLSDEGQINWLKFNELKLNLHFNWMQDNEIQNCERVDINRVKKSGLDSDTIALLKIQSLNGIDRRHFMVMIESTYENAICLESYGETGKIEIRTISHNEILGVRYLVKRPNPELPNI